MKRRDKNALVELFANGRLTASGTETASGKCTICGQLFSNWRSIYLHMIRRHPGIHYEDDNKISHDKQGTIDRFLATTPSERACEPDSTLCCTEFEKKLIRAICRLGMSLSSIERKEFIDLIESVGGKPDMIPEFPKLRSLTLIHADEVFENSISNMKGRHVTGLIDGGTVMEKTFYCLVWFCERKLFFGGIYHVPVADHASLAAVLADPVRKVREAGAVVTAILTDNAKNLCLATTPSDFPGPGLSLSNQKTSVQQLTNTSIIHVSCSVHTTHLILADLAKEDANFVKFKSDIQSLFRYLHLRPVKQFMRSHGISGKIPKIQEIKWLTFYEAFDFIKRNTDQLSICLPKWKEYATSAPIVVSIPEEWFLILETLEPMGRFIIGTQRETIYLWEFHREQLKLVELWTAMSNPLADKLRRLLERRFEETADGDILKLSYIFCLKGVDDIRKRYEPLYYSLTVNVHEMSEIISLQEEQNRMAMKLATLLNYWGLEKSEEVVRVLFDVFMKSLVMGKFQHLERPEAFYRWLGTQVYVMQTSAGDTKTIAWRPFAAAAVRLLQLPASESVIERAFSHLQLIVPPQRSRCKDDIISAQMCIRMQSIFDESNKQFDFNRE